MLLELEFGSLENMIVVSVKLLLEMGFPLLIYMIFMVAFNSK